MARKLSGSLNIDIGKPRKKALWDIGDATGKKQYTMIFEALDAYIAQNKGNVKPEKEASKKSKKKVRKK